MTSRLIIACLLVTAAAAVAVLWIQIDDGPITVPQATGGRPAAGRLAIQQHGCTSCHVIPGVTAPQSRVGPPLAGLAGRRSIAGDLPNTPESLIRWIQSPQSVEPGTIMPDLGVTEAEARDIAAYLYTR